MRRSASARRNSEARSTSLEYQTYTHCFTGLIAVTYGVRDLRFAREPTGEKSTGRAARDCALSGHPASGPLGASRSFPGYRTTCGRVAAELTTSDKLRDRPTSALRVRAPSAGPEAVLSTLVPPAGLRPPRTTSTIAEWSSERAMPDEGGCGPPALPSLFLLPRMRGSFPSRP